MLFSSLLINIKANLPSTKLGSLKELYLNSNIRILCIKKLHFPVTHTFVPITNHLCLHYITKMQRLTVFENKHYPRRRSAYNGNNKFYIRFTVVIHIFVEFFGSFGRHHHKQQRLGRFVYALNSLECAAFAFVFASLVAMR